MEAEKKNIKVDAYDFFGYLIPGFILLAILVFVHITFAYSGVGNYPEIKDIATFDIKPYQAIAISLIIILVSYVLGHVIASVASFVFEKFVIKSIFGYPYHLLLFSKPERIELFGNEAYEKMQLTAEKSKATTIIAYLLFSLFCFFPKSMIDFIMSYYLIIALIVILWVFYRDDFSSELKFIRSFFSYAFEKIESIVSLFSGHNRPMPIPMRRLFFNKFEREFKVSHKDLDSEIFWAVYWKITKNDAYIKGKIDKWLVLYSFMRNLGCALLLSALALASRQLMLGQSFQLGIHSFSLLVISVILTIRYYYLYYSYYSKSIFRIYIYMDDKGPKLDRIGGVLFARNKPLRKL